MITNLYIRSKKISGKCLSLLLGCILILSAVYSQNSAVGNQIGLAFNQYRSNNYQEKLFVHTDKDSYISREILWFRIYYVDAFNNKPATLSKIAYLEMLDRYNRPILQEKVSLKPGESFGSVIIPVNISSGIYKLRAYTNWMKNFSPDYYFEKSIRIINPQNLEPDSTAKQKNRFDIQFFPEGGNLVQNLESRVGFRITDAFGKGLACEGVLLNSDADTILKFHPLDMGLGNFVFTPAAGKSYKAIISFPNGEHAEKDLPVSYAAGYVMNLSKTTQGHIAIKVNVSPELEGQEIYLFVHGFLTASPVRKEQLNLHTADFLIPREDLEDGISRFTVFDKNGQPVCERLYFKYPRKKISILAETETEYGTRKKVDLNLTVMDSAGKSLLADMSMAIYRIDSLQSSDEANILSYLYLTSDLGPVESPCLYFDDHYRYMEAGMDNLMLTQGWRRFIWKNILQQKTWPFEYTAEFDGHIISGKLVDNKSGRGVPDVAAFLSIPSTRTQFRSTISEAGGRVKFEMPGFYGSQEIIVQTDPKADSSSHIEIASPFSDKYSLYLLPEFSMPSVYSSALLDQSIHEQVQHIYNGPRLNQYVMRIIDTNAFYVVPDEKYKLDDYTRFLTMEEVLREYVKSVNVIERGNKFRLTLVDNPHRTLFEGDPLILIDGVPFFDPNELFQQDPKKIRRIELVNRQYVLGYQTFDGVVNVTTYKGDLNGIQMNPRAIVLDYPGIPEEREFFSPVYETEEQISSRMPDFRTLLYWSPEIKSLTEEKKRISFYTSDLPGKYIIVIQCLTENGVPGSRVVSFNVKNQ